MHPIIVSFGPITVYSFGVMLAIAFLTAGNVVQRELARKGLDPELASSFVLWAAIGGLVGSRILSVFDDWQGFVAHPLAFVFTGAGFVFYGGLIGGFLTVSWVIWRRGLPWLRIVDCIAPALAVGQAIGRIGCQLAGDGDWGRPSTLPWAMSYPHAIIGWEEWTRQSGLPVDVRVHPAPVYEMLAYGAVFLVLWARRRRPHPDGYILWLYLLLSGAVRFLVEFVRINPEVAFGLTEAQLISLALVAFGAVQLWRASANGTAAARIDVRSAGPPLALLLALVAALGCQRGGALVGKSAPEFSLSDLSGRAVRLANLKGRVVFLNVWATWCEPCRAEMPAMQGLYSRLRGPDFEMLAVSADQEGQEVVERFVEEHRLTFPVLPDPNLQVAERYKVTGYPETFVIDRNGRVVAHEIGPRDWDAPEAVDAFRMLIERGEWRGM